MSLITVNGKSLSILSTPNLWTVLWKTIREHESVYFAVIRQVTDPAQIKVIRNFLRLWDPVYTEAMEIEGLHGQVSEARLLRLVTAFFVARNAAIKIGLGKDSRGTYHPRIDDSSMRILLAHRLSPNPIGGPMTVPASFRATLTARICDDNLLHVEGCHRGRCYSTSIDLKPIISQVKEMIRRYHLHVLHGDMQRDTISGLGDWYRSSVRAAARIANAKAAKALWAKVQSGYGAIEAALPALGPYGQAAAIGLRTGKTIQNLLTKAKQGDPKAVDDVRSIVSLAKQGDPSAKQVTDVMKAMNEMGKAKDEKREAIGGWFFHRPYRVAAVSPDMVLRGLYNLGVAS